MEIREVGKENVGDLFVPCGPNKPSYIREKDYISSLWREERVNLSFFKKFGFEETDITLFGTIKFIMKKHREDAEPPESLTPALSHIKMDDKVVVEIIRDNQCPYIRVWENKLKDVLKEFDNKILLKEYETRNRDEALKFGMSTVYVDGEEPFFGSVDEKEIREKITEYLKRKGLI